MLDDRELWAMAHQVTREHGRHVIEFMLERLASLEEAKDAEGLRTWTAIANRVSLLIETDGQQTLQ